MLPLRAYHEGYAAAFAVWLATQPLLKERFRAQSLGHDETQFTRPLPHAAEKAFCLDPVGMTGLALALALLMDGLIACVV